MKKKNMWFLAVFASLVMLLTACGGNASNTSEQPAENNSSSESETEESTKPTIKVGMVCGGMTPLIAQVGIHDGSFEKAGIQVEEVCFNAGADAVSALVGGSIDINLGSYEHVLKMVANNLGVKAYGQLYNGVGYSLVVKKDAPYESLADVKGETLAVTKPGSLSDTGLRRGLEGAGMDPDKDVNIIGSGSGSTMLAAIESDKVVGGMASEPTISQMTATGDYRVLYEPDFDYAGIVIMAKEDWVNDNREAMEIFAKELLAVNERAQEDPKHAAETMQDSFESVEPEVLEQAVKNQLTKAPPGLKVTEAGAKTVTEVALQFDIIKEEISYEDAVDTSFFK